jgi:predicted membrane-bound dolichyl-phosphate-mannose-protein mannosyltransferase
MSEAAIYSINTTDQRDKLVVKQVGEQSMASSYNSTSVITTGGKQYLLERRILTYFQIRHPLFQKWIMDWI